MLAGKIFGNLSLELVVVVVVVSVIALYKVRAGRPLLAVQ